MYRCMDCGAEFDKPRVIRESYGQEFAYCTNCLSENIEDIEDLKCEACEDGYVDYKGEKWCHECKSITAQAMHDVILKTARETNLSISNIVDAIEDLMDGGSPRKTDYTITENLMIGIGAIAYDTGCSIETACEMVEAWSIGTMY